MTADTSAAAPRQELRSEDDPDAAPADQPGQDRPSASSAWSRVVWGLANLFLAFAYYPRVVRHSKFVIGILAIIGGVGGAALLFYFLNMFVEGLPRRLSEGVDPLRLPAARARCSSG